MSVPQTAEGELIDRAATAPAVSLTELSPPGGLLVFVPHPDDESLGCGLALATAAGAGRRIGFVFVTDGEGSHPGSATWPADRLKKLRAAERDAALRVLFEVAGPDAAATSPALHLHLPDGQSRPADAAACRSAVAAFSERLGARAVWTTWGGDPHCDHRTAARLAATVASDRDVPLWSYAVWGRFGPARAPAAGLRRFDRTEQRDRKARAVACHRSQLTPMIDDDPRGFCMPPVLTEHFVASPELFLPGAGLSPENGRPGATSPVDAAACDRGRTANRRATFDALHADGSDPWDFETSDYERDKRAATLAALPRQRYSDALEVGCSLGVLTEQLAPRCGSLTAVDVSPVAAARARARLTAYPRVRIVVADVPTHWPTPPPPHGYDLVVLSEVLYFLQAVEIDALARQTHAALARHGHVLLVNWTGPNDLPLNGDAAAERFLRSGAWRHRPVVRAEQYRIDLALPR